MATGIDIFLVGFLVLVFVFIIAVFLFLRRTMVAFREGFQGR